MSLKNKITKIAKKILAEYPGFEEKMEVEFEIVVKGRGEGMEGLANMMRYIADNGNTGHSFGIVVDPKSADEKEFGWDGDGRDAIKSVTLNGKEIK